MSVAVKYTKAPSHIAKALKRAKPVADFLPVPGQLKLKEP